MENRLLAQNGSRWASVTRQVDALAEGSDL
jgi:hypothetical protein